MKKVDRQPLTKKAFECLLGKVFLSPKDVQEVRRTSAPHPSGGYSGKCKSRGKTEGKEDSRSD